MSKTNLTEVSGIGEATAGVLERAGFHSAEDLANAAIEDISAVPGFGYMRAQRVRAQAKDMIDTAAAPQDQAGDGAVSVLGDAPVKKSNKKKDKKKKDKKKAKGGKEDKKKGKKGKKK